MGSVAKHRVVLRRTALVGCAALLFAEPASPAFAATDPEPFVISGGPAGPLHPGTSQALDLTLFNPNSGALVVSSLSVRVDSVRPVGPQAACTTADFAVDSVHTLGPLVVPPGASDLLSALGLEPSAMPRVRMLNTDLDQDGCKQAEVVMAYEGAGLTREADGAERPTGGHGSGTGGVGNLPGTGASHDGRAFTLIGLALVALGAGMRFIRRTARVAR